MAIAQILRFRNTSNVEATEVMKIANRYASSRILQSAIKSMLLNLDSAYEAFPADPERELLNSAISVVRGLKALVMDIYEERSSEIDFLALARIAMQLGESSLAQQIFWSNFDDELDKQTHEDISDYKKFIANIPEDSAEIRKRMTAELERRLRG